MALVHHYTDAGGLIGIIKSRAIWATSVWFMNDSVEATFGWERIDSFLKSRKPSSEQEGRVIHVARDGLRGVRTRDDFPDSYIACFSGKGNDLSQWRAYGHGKGFSIAFDTDALDRLALRATDKDSRPTTRKVAYSDAQQEQILAVHYEQLILAALAQKGDTDVAGLAGAFSVMGIMAAPSLKHPAFEAEDEWRLQFFLDKNDDRVRFRDSVMGVTPYIEVPLGEAGSDTIRCIKEIRVGPQRHPDEALRAVRQLLITNNLDAIEVKPATIPLRSS